MFEHLTKIAAEFWSTVGEMAPFLLLGFFMAGVLSVALSADWIERNLGRGRISSVIKASAFGVPLPLCSCGVIPVGASLRRHGADKGAVTAFLISTPQTGVDSILATFSLLGWVFAVFRPIAALVSGVLGGSVVSAFESDGASDAREKKDQCTDSCCTAQGVGKIAAAMKYGLVTLPRDIGKALLIGLIAGALISMYISKDYFSQTIPPGAVQILVLMLVGIPLYICATASIPIAAGLIVAGVSPGAAFAMLMTGPATNAATIVTIWKVLGRRTCLIYLGTMMVSAFVGGMLLDQLVTIGEVRMAMHHGWLPTWAKHASAVVLLGMLGVGALWRPADESHGEQHDKHVLHLEITGMTCSHCAASVKGALLECDGVSDVSVDLDAGAAYISGSDLDVSELTAAVEQLGYGASEPEKAA